MRWVLGNVNRDENIMWLYDSAGVGKSAIAHSIAELCAAKPVLLASFFSADRFIEKAR
jgi:ATP-dependent Lon protease